MALTVSHSLLEKKIEKNHFAIFAGGFGTLSTSTPRSECCFVSMYSKANHILNLMKPCRCRCGIYMNEERKKNIPWVLHSIHKLCLTH